MSVRINGKKGNRSGRVEIKVKVSGCQDEIQVPGGRRKSHGLTRFGRKTTLANLRSSKRNVGRAEVFEKASEEGNEFFFFFFFSTDSISSILTEPLVLRE